ncbi:PF20097 family protein [Paraclostridium sordellii]|uniref:PF20097 family protein n=1 Tax=Paraclostridium sordellii TaxID=1505 RepID=UPI0005E92EBC|nr:PF20097 family protein [Paeniclostridium sordellii]MBS6025780.1 hypothetical protein [Paeniclostridium sordellii]CEO26145.1 Uncharacterised protein [[Clostridium] sordellii] [Paeniclostridium sordellii]
MMEKTCPYCKGELTQGFIDGDRGSLKWHNENMGILEKYTIFGGEKLSINSRIKCLRCEKCNKIIIDLEVL